ncbi:GGDEF domain-containing protein [Oscillospiraceae bacterium MB08-C2-2]|nr:GGDEF domain-containing protein [Oscillospiraceae bacterium MB08-C2-2]
MSEDQMNQFQVSQIQQEYDKIDNHWLNLHYIISVAAVVLAFALEWIISIFVMSSDMRTSSVPVYLLKYIAAPSGTNFFLLLVGTAVIRSRKLSRTFKMYAVSIMFTLICFVLFTAHSIFVATYYIFSGAVILTTVYASYWVTFCTAFLSTLLLIVSEAFIVWDVDKETIFNSSLRFANFLVALSILVALTGISMVVVRYERKKNTVSIRIERERLILQQSLQLDELTGIFNRKALLDMLRDMDVKRTMERCIFSMVDIDKFKNINDTLGHQAGDQCLSGFAQVLSQQCEDAIPFRYGGDEFCLLFPQTDMAQAVRICQGIQEKLEEQYVITDPDLKLTASFGLAEYYKGMKLAELFIRADQALYQAKAQRGSIRVYVGEGEFSGPHQVSSQY